VDSSGLRITYTPNLRQHDAGTIETGHIVSPFDLIIPPNMESFLTYGECTDQCLSSVSFAVDDVVFKWLLLLRKCNAAVHYIENRMHQKQACMKIKLQRKESHSHFSTLPPPPSTTVYHLGIRVCISAFYNSGGCLKIGSLLQFSLPQCCVANSHSIHYIQQETRKLNVIMGFP